MDTAYAMIGQTVADTITYRPFGPLSGLTFGNGLTMARVHDQQYRLTEQITGTVQDVTFTLDAAGNTTDDAAANLSFTYDVHNRMVEAYTSAALQATYAYNGHGQRIKEVEAIPGGRTFVFHYGPNAVLLGESVYDSLGALIAERDYLWLEILPLAQSERALSGGTVTSDQFVYLHADQLNTPRLASDAMGTIVWRWDSDAFGVGAADLDPDADLVEVNVRLRFPGQYFDAETGLHYNYYRDYDPSTGRYLTSDPIGLSGGINTYGYALQNPVRYTDPEGLLTPLGVGVGLVCIVGTGIAAASDVLTVADATKAANEALSEIKRLEEQCPVDEAAKARQAAEIERLRRKSAREIVRSSAAKLKSVGIISTGS